MSKLMPNATNLYLSGDDNLKNSISIHLGGSIFPCLLDEQIGGGQPFRTQVDVTLDGSIYLLSAGQGIGNHTFTVFEGPFPADCGPSMNCISEKYASLGTLESRMIKIAYTDQPSALTFTGVINNLTTFRRVEASGNIIIVTKVEALGIWA